MTKYTVGETILHQWTPSYWESDTIQAVLPKKWWQRSHRYIIDDRTVLETNIAPKNKKG